MYDVIVVEETGINSTLFLCAIAAVAIVLIGIIFMKDTWSKKAPKLHGIASVIFILGIALFFAFIITMGVRDTLAENRLPDMLISQMQSQLHIENVIMNDDKEFSGSRDGQHISGRILEDAATPGGYIVMYDK